MKFEYSLAVLEDKDMSGKIILNLAMSLDGYIADESGGYDWIIGDGNPTLNTDEKWDYNQFLEDIDVVVMGKNCYDQGFHRDFIGKEVYITTSKEIENDKHYCFIKGDVVNQIQALKSEGKNIFLFGGGIMIDPFIKENAIDEYVIGIIPIILGRGKKLFLENNPTIDLQLQSYSVENGIIIMKYLKRKLK